VQREWATAVRAGEAAEVARLLDLGHEIDALDRYGQTGLMLAALHGRLEVAQLLIERGADLDVAAKFNLTALMLAIVNWRESIAVALVESGADLDHRGSGAPGFAGLSALDLARARELGAVVAAIEERWNAPR
jgi:ankyrin repeat protein